MLAKDLATGTRFYAVGEEEFSCLAVGYESRDRVLVTVQSNRFDIEAFRFTTGGKVTGVCDLETMECEHCGGKGFRRSGDRNVCGACGRIKQ